MKRRPDWRALRADATYVAGSLAGLYALMLLAALLAALLGVGR